MTGTDRNEEGNEVTTMAIDPMTKLKAEGLERMAALRERHAQEAEERARRYGGRTPQYFQALEKSEQFEKEAREMRAEATRLRTQRS